MNELLTTKQAAERLSLSHERVTLLCRSEVLKAERVGGIYLIRTDDLEAFAAVERKPGRPRTRKVDVPATSADTGGHGDEG